MLSDSNVQPAAMDMLMLPESSMCWINSLWQLLQHVRLPHLRQIFLV